MKTQTSMKKHFKNYLVLLSCYVGVLSTAYLALVIVYFLTESTTLVIILFCFTAIFLVLNMIAATTFYERVKRLYYENLFVVTKKNYELLSEQKRPLSQYSHPEIAEFSGLNAKVEDINRFLSNLTLASRALDYDNFSLVYPREDDKSLVTIKSFVENLRQFILCANAFRNALVFATFDAPVENIEESDYDKIIELYKKHLKFDNSLYAVARNRGGVLAFIPNIDSLSFVEECIYKMAKEGVVSKYHVSGVDVINMRISMVVYPYSTLDGILDDLTYANRQGKTVNIYIPEKLNKGDNLMNHETLYLNNITKIFIDFNKSLQEGIGQDIAYKRQTNLMKNIRTYLGFENVGIFMYELFTRMYYCTFNDCEDGVEPIFTKSSTLDTEFVNALADVADKDGTYYFSCRENASDKIAKYLDIYGIKSGHFYIIKYKNEIRALFYFVNRKDKLFITNYQRECLLIFSSYQGTFSREIMNHRNTTDAQARVTDILRLSDLDLYTVNRNDYRLAFISDALKDVIGDINQGDICYKKLYGLDAPCEDCPILHNRKKKSLIKDVNCVTSTVLTRRKSIFTTLLISHPKNSEYDTNRFHGDLFVFSNYSLFERLNMLFKANVRGRLLLISIDNYRQLVRDYNNEGYFLRIRTFIHEIEEKIGIKADIFAYSDYCLAIILPEEGRVDLIKRCEAIHGVSKNIMLAGELYSISPTFISFDFPSDFPSPVEMYRSMEKYLKENNSLYDKENIIFVKDNYIRSASKEKYMLNVLDEAFRKNQILIKLLPIVGRDNKSITGAEMLLRLYDDYLNITLPAFEFIDIARRNGKISDISNYLINYMGRIYQKYGISVFKSAGYRYFAINTDASFFKESNFITLIGNLMNKYHLPKDFVAFEITEKDIHDNYEFYKQIYKRVLSYDMRLVADAYTGQYLSLDKLHAIGFTSVKVSRNIVAYIDKDIRRLNEVKSIIKECADMGMRACLVGLENKEQITLLKDVTEPFFKQGYYYYEPMDIEELVDKLGELNK